jgi:tetratricopeptide (TPR) repeat protein
MARFRPLLVTAAIAFSAGSCVAGPDDSVWYQPNQPAAQPTPSNPAPPSTNSPMPRSSVTVRVGGSIYSYGGDFYYPSGTGYPNVHPYYYGYGRRSYYGRYYSPSNWRYYRTYDTPDTSTLIELARRYDPELIGVDPNAEPPTARELGEIAMKNAEYGEAITKFSEAHDEQKRADSASDQPNRQAQRLLGIAYAADRQFEFAGQQLVAAFETDPSLRNLPIRGEDLFKDGLELNSVVSRAVGFAHRNPSYESWFTVAVLMQAQGKNDLANDMIKRAEAARSSASVEQQTDKPADQTPPQATPKPAERAPETEAERLRRELRESTERLEETKHRLEEIKRKQREAEQDAGGETSSEN